MRWASQRQPLNARINWRHTERSIQRHKLRQITQESASINVYWHWGIRLHNMQILMHFKLHNCANWHIWLCKCNIQQRNQMHQLMYLCSEMKCIKICILCSHNWCTLLRDLILLHLLFSASIGPIECHCARLYRPIINLPVLAHYSYYTVCQVVF